jgi:hypothetical protein
MSGGHFDYGQWHITEIAEEIEEIIIKNEENDRYPKDIIQEFKKGVDALRKAHVYAQRIDWLVSGDDGEDSFRERLKEDLEKL